MGQRINFRSVGLRKKFDKNTIREIEGLLQLIHKDQVMLPGIQNEASRRAFIKQLIESTRRVEFIKVLKARPISPRTKDPTDLMFDPLKAAFLHMHENNEDEAFWLVFLFVHFGKHAKAGWRYAKEVYGRLNDKNIWNWKNVSSNIEEFKAWLHANQTELMRKDGPRGFGNHRKYQSLDAYSKVGTGAAVESYVNWVSPPRTHRELMDRYCENGTIPPKLAFDRIYHSMSSIISFGRTARFDYLCLIGNMGLAQIEPGLAYIGGATGPKSGAQLLFAGNKRHTLGSRYIEEKLEILDQHLNVGKQVLEDCLCNWQKSPEKFVPFRG